MSHGYSHCGIGRVYGRITFSDADKAFGDHLEAGTRGFTFAGVTLGVINDGADLKWMIRRIGN